MPIPGKISSQQNINYQGLKITVYMHSWGKLWTIRYQKTKKPRWHFWRAGRKNRVLGAKAEDWACPLHSAPIKQWASHLSHPSGWTPGPAPTLPPYKEPAHHLNSGSDQGQLTALVLAAPCCSRGPNKAFSEFLFWPLINFYWLKRPRTLGVNKELKHFSLPF